MKVLAYRDKVAKLASAVVEATRKEKEINWRRYNQIFGLPAAKEFPLDFYCEALSHGIKIRPVYEPPAGADWMAMRVWRKVFDQRDRERHFLSTTNHQVEVRARDLSYYLVRQMLRDGEVIFKSSDEGGNQVNM